jgi:hypothetical protein
MSDDAENPRLHAAVASHLDPKIAYRASPLHPPALHALSPHAHRRVQRVAIRSRIATARPIPPGIRHPPPLAIPPHHLPTHSLFLPQKQKIDALTHLPNAASCPSYPSRPNALSNTLAVYATHARQTTRRVRHCMPSVSSAEGGDLRERG